jgi:hypothetical protein
MSLYFGENIEFKSFFLHPFSGIMRSLHYCFHPDLILLAFLSFLSPTNINGCLIFPDSVVFILCLNCQPEQVLQNALEHRIVHQFHLKKGFSKSDLSSKCLFCCTIRNLHRFLVYQLMLLATGLH